MSATGKDHLHLLRTKLYRPRTTCDLVERPRLREVLERYVDRTVTLICAPAGFGKTTLATDWLEHTACRGAWLSLDESDGDLRGFVAYFVATVQALFPASCAESSRLLDAADLPPTAELVTAVANDLDALAGDSDAERFALVLDDYHLVTDAAVHQFLGQLLRHPPRGIHLVICTRHDPPFVGHALRARGDFSEIRSGELRFTPGEVAALMQRLLPVPPSAETLDALVQRTEGWGAGLRLTALALEAGGQVPAPELVSDNRYTLDYLFDEVLSRVPEATVDFLLKTAILDRLTGPLCDALVPPAVPNWNGAAYLEWLAAQNVFTFAVDGQGRWYRYHHQFQKLLRRELARRLAPEEIEALRSRAARWLAENKPAAEAPNQLRAERSELAAMSAAGPERGDQRNRAVPLKFEHWADRPGTAGQRGHTAFGQTGPAAFAQPAPGALGQRARQSDDARMVDPLSEREMDVLLLMSQRLSHKEIAEALTISPQTVKRHAANIYQKLAVNGRRDAIAAAASLGILQLPPAPAARHAYFY